MAQSLHYASLPTYIPPVNFASAFPAYMPSTSAISRSRSGRIVYDDDPWNSAKAQPWSVAKAQGEASSPRRPKGPRERPASWLNQSQVAGPSTRKPSLLSIQTTTTTSSSVSRKSSSDSSTRRDSTWVKISYKNPHPSTQGSSTQVAGPSAPRDSSNARRHSDPASDTPATQQRPISLQVTVPAPRGPSPSMQGGSRPLSTQVAGPSAPRGPVNTGNARRHSDPPSDAPAMSVTAAVAQQRPTSMQVTPRASPFNIPYSIAGDLSINHATAPLNIYRQPSINLPRQPSPIPRQPSPPSTIHSFVSGRPPTPPPVQKRHPTFLLPGVQPSSSSSIQGRFAASSSTDAEKYLHSLSSTAPPTSYSPPSPDSPIAHPITPPPVLSPLMASQVWKSPSGATNPPTTCGSPEGSVSFDWEAVTRRAKNNSSGLPVERKVSDNTAEAPTSPVHSLSITEIEYMLWNHDAPSVHRREAEEVGSCAASSPLEGAEYLESPMEEQGYDGEMSAFSDTQITLNALRRQLDDDEQDEKEWSSITDMLLSRVISRATTLNSNCSI
ncbi:hypothetical protein FRB94_013529 [Tulasnella sp. JGI-2019a]|nr:hypothetical protein FRB93_005125 [Tulasnella sp. JGI-2019a]KAG9014219.1 hypothetical protein FRB94_013529 [Tulasnella sp. JGI-2019a]KAG9035940.1 hypothetical protein FRB95_010148 [Tulasnella sp. JGI-2019a]